MKWISYKLLQGMTDNGEIILLTKSMCWSEENEAIAAVEAYNGVYVIEDDGLIDPKPEPTEADRIAELEAAVNAFLGVNE